MNRDPRGFGLLQRDRDFDHYQDIETHQHERPGVWITPRGDWGSGHVELVQIPSDNEINDNIVAFWVPSNQLVPGSPQSYAYSMFWGTEEEARTSPIAAGRVVSTRVDGAETKLVEARAPVEDVTEPFRHPVVGPREAGA